MLTNHKILINHETPFCMMQEMQTVTDYDYCLVHLCYTNPEYKQFFIDAIKKGRKVLLDNSVFELEEPFNPDKFVEAINELNPTWYIVPDFLDDKAKTIDSMKNWIKNYLPKVKTNSKIIGSIQGATIQDLTECYCFMAQNKNVSKVAITFNSIAFNEICPDIVNDPAESEKRENCVDERDLQIWMEGRQRFITKLVLEGYWNNDKPHHLLGSGYIREFAYPLYHRISVESLDTSNPTIYGLNRLDYDSILGNTIKPKMKLCDHLEDNLDSDQMVTIRYNVHTFREIVNRYLEGKDND